MDPNDRTLAAGATGPLDATLHATPAAADTLPLVRDVDAVAATVAVTPVSGIASSQDARASVPPASDFLGRYLERALLGEGGMGAVVLFRDHAIGRDVALKRMKSARAHAMERERFLREARVQGQLEHPSIVPVYDLGMLPDGAPYFTMKRVRGETLDDILARLAKGDADALAKYGRRKLLAAFATVCLAVDFAHSRGVLHRDLKPSNVMLGEFGEVNVLDWGLAKVRAFEDLRGDAVVDVESVPDHQTIAGSMMGTPGYMSPEQVEGRIEQLDERTDVYALGAMLFEILHLEALHPARGAAARLATTLTGQTADEPRQRSGDVPPELDRVWRAAVARSLDARTRTARELAEALERYLDGERDEARRHELARTHVENARREDTRSPEGRARALRELGRALALDPAHEEALQAVSAMLTSLPSEIPPEARAAIDAAQHERRVQTARTSVVRLATWIVAIPLVVAFGVRDWSRASVLVAMLVASALFALYTWRTRKVSDGWTLALMGVSSSAIALVSFVLGPFVVVPSLAATNAMFFAMNAERAMRPWIVGLGVLTILAPFALSALGLDASYYGFTPEGALTITSPMVALSAVPTGLFLVLVSIALVVTPTLLAGRMRDDLVRAEERVLLQAHYLAQLVPHGARREPEPARDPST